MLAEFFAWWGEQLYALTPARFRAGAGQGEDGLIADATGPGTLVLLRRRRGQEQRVEAGRLDELGQTRLRAALADLPRDERLTLRLSPAQALERNVALPIAAERDPESVLAYDLERLIPFPPEDVFWGYALLARDRARSRLEVRLIVVPRVRVQPLLDLLESWGAKLAAIEIPGPGGARLIRLAHEGRAGGRARLRLRAAAAVCAVLLAAVVATPFARQQLGFAELADREALLAPRIQQVDALRRRIAGAGAGSEAVAAETRRLGDTLEALAAVTEILPDDSYLTEFTMRERKMTLSGLSASAPKLISLLSDDSRIRNPSFTAPVTRNEAAQRDVFSIRAELAD